MQLLVSSEVYIYIYIYIYMWGEAKTRTFMLGTNPHLLTKMRSRRSKCLERLHGGWSCREMFVGSDPRGLSSSDLTNVS